MAALDYNLYQELRSRYPEVPDTIVTCHMQQLHNDREKCMETLASESPKYLFGTQSSESSADHLVNRMHDISFTSTYRDQSGRSDSNSSSMSNTSTCSNNNNISTTSRPPFSTSHSLMTPGSRDPVSFTEHELNHPGTAQALQTDLSRFLFTSQAADSIPNINCNNSVGYEGQSGGYGASYSQTEILPVSQPQPQPPPQLRQIKVHHMTSEDNQAESVSNPTPISPNPLYEIRFDPKIGNASSSSHVSKPLSLIHSNSNSGWTHHPVKPNYSTVYPGGGSSAFTLDHRNQGMGQHNRQSPSPVHTSQYHGNEDQRYKSGMYIQGQNPYSAQHSSQATIYLQNPTGANNLYNADRTGHGGVPAGQYITQAGPYNRDPRMSPVNYRSPTSPGQQQNVTQQSSQSYSKQLFVELKSPGQEGVQSQIQYFNKLARNDNRMPSVPVGTVGLIGGAGNVSSGPSNFSQSSYVDRLSTPERPSVIDIQGARTSQDEAGFIQFPHMPNVCRVPGHPQTLVHSGSVDSETGRAVFSAESRAVPHRPFISPASSHSSLSSESSQREPQRPRSGSLQDDPAYTQALLSHQKSRMEKLTEDLSIAEQRLNDLKKEVTLLESKAIEKKRKRNSSFPSTADLAGLRSDNLQLQADIQLMTREIDLLNNGQTPLGVLDPLEQQNFYKTMNTGQRGSIYAPGQGPGATSLPVSATAPVAAPIPAPLPKDASLRLPPAVPPALPPRDFPPPLPPRIHPVPPPPPPQPTVNSGDSDADGEQWNCSACTFLNHPALNKCECCEMPRINTSFSPPTDQDVPERIMP